MYAQLGAIAREFNFPSTSGICLYMHVNEAGGLFAPRISEESWGILWGHLFEPNAPCPTSGLPISGRIEFDVGRFRNGAWHRLCQLTHNLQMSRKLGGITPGFLSPGVKPHHYHLCHPPMSPPCIN